MGQLLREGAAELWDAAIATWEAELAAKKAKLATVEKSIEFLQIRRAMVKRMVQWSTDLLNKAAQAADPDAGICVTEPEWQAMMDLRELDKALGAAMDNQDWAAAENHAASMRRCWELLDQATAQGSSQSRG